MNMITNIVFEVFFFESSTPFQPFLTLFLNCVYFCSFEAKPLIVPFSYIFVRSTALLSKCVQISIIRTEPSLISKTHIQMPNMFLGYVSWVHYHEAKSLFVALFDNLVVFTRSIIQIDDLYPEGFSNHSLFF